MPEDDAQPPAVPTTEAVATVVYESSHGGQVEQRGPVIYQYGDEESDPRSVHILLDAERVLTASTTTGEVRTVAVEDALVEAVSETPGPDGDDVLAASTSGER